MGYVSHHDHALLDFRLSLPPEWARDEERRQALPADAWVSPQKTGAESPCPNGLSRGRKAGIMARNTRNFSLLEPAALCAKRLTCTASPMNRHAHSSDGCSTCWKT